jgi:toxin ParE1/3/4
MRVRHTPRARADLEEIVQYITSDNPHAAERVRRAIFDAIELVATHPYAGIKNARAPELRSKLVSRYPYRVHYQVSVGELWIVHIRHTARRPWGGEAK